MLVTWIFGPDAGYADGIPVGLASLIPAKYWNSVLK
jgi:hypothetical protein